MSVCVRRSEINLMSSCVNLQSLSVSVNGEEGLAGELGVGPPLRSPWTLLWQAQSCGSEINVGCSLQRSPQGVSVSLPVHLCFTSSSSVFKRLSVSSDSLKTQSVVHLPKGVIMCFIFPPLRWFDAVFTVNLCFEEGERAVCFWKRRPAQRRQAEKLSLRTVLHLSDSWTPEPFSWPTDAGGAFRTNRKHFGWHANIKHVWFDVDAWRRHLSPVQLELVF